jgi:hypothetical protein
MPSCALSKRVQRPSEAAQKVPKATPQSRAANRFSDCEHARSALLAAEPEAARLDQEEERALKRAHHISPKPAAPKALGRGGGNGETAAQRRSRLAASAATAMRLGLEGHEHAPMMRSAQQ